MLVGEQHYGEMGTITFLTVSLMKLLKRDKHVNNEQFNQTYVLMLVFFHQANMRGLLYFFHPVRLLGTLSPAL